MPFLQVHHYNIYFEKCTVRKLIPDLLESEGHRFRAGYGNDIFIKLLLLHLVKEKEDKGDHTPISHVALDGLRT